MMSEPKARESQRMSFKTVSYLLGNFSDMASYLYKPKTSPSKVPNEFQALKGSDIVTSINAIQVPKKQRTLTDHFNEDQLSSSLSDGERSDQEGSSTSDDSQDTSIEITEN